MAKLPDHLNVPMPDDATEDQQQGLADGARDEAVEKYLDDGEDELFAGLDGIK